MSRAIDIADDMEAAVGQNYFWGPTAGALYLWARNQMPLANIGRSANDFVNCFGFPMLLAVRRGYLGPASVLRIIGDTQRRGDLKAKAFSSAWVSVLWTDWKAIPGSAWRPRRGDLVFFEATIGGLLNHVAVSTGNITLIGDHSEVISFGERMTQIGAATVNRTSIEAQRQQGHTSVRFLTPTWD